MDIKREKPTGVKAIFRGKNLPYLTGGVLAMLIAWLWLSGNPSALRTSSELLTISQAHTGEFREYIRVDGEVLPISSVQLSPLEGGLVEEILVEEGAQVTKGEVLVVLSNPNLNLSILDSEAQLAEKQNFLRNTQVTMEQERLALRQERLQLELEVKRKLRAYQQAESLYGEQLLAREEWLMAREDYELAVSRRELIFERQKQDSIYRSVQIEQMEESLRNMQRNMTLVRDRVENLHIKSPIDGELGLLDVVLGQSIQSGQDIGQVNDLSNFKLEAQISEHYIDRVNAGLTAQYERQAERYLTTLRKVYPEVREGMFRADFRLAEARPEQIRAGQTYYLNLQLSEPRTALLIPRGSFFQSTAGKWIFVVDKSGTQAHKRLITIGRHNPDYYEVIEGLEEGERVITSSYESFGDKETLILN